MYILLPLGRVSFKFQVSHVGQKYCQDFFVLTDFVFFPVSYYENVETSNCNVFVHFSFELYQFFVSFILKLFKVHKLLRFLNVLDELILLPLNDPYYLCSSSSLLLIIIMVYIFSIHFLYWALFIKN